MKARWTPRSLAGFGIIALVAALFAAPVYAQDDYGIGVTVNVRQVDPSTMTMDGVPDEPVWDLAPTFDLLQYTNFYAVVDEADLTIDARALWAEDTLYVFARVYDNDIFVPADAGDAWMADQLLVGVDGTHAGDDQTDPDYAGWPDNAPDKGPTVYKVWPEGITLNWGFDDISPVDSGWVNGSVYVDSTNFEWGVEMAIYVPQIEANADIGFNIGGAQAGQAALDEGSEEATYGYYSWQAAADGSAGGDVMNNAATYATLHMEPRTGGGGDGYGSGVTVVVPEADPDALVMDGSDDEAAWANAPEFDLLQYSNFYAMVDEPDLQATGKTLFSNDTLYVFVRVLDNEIFTPEDAGDAWMSDQILIGVDGTHAGDDQIDDSYAGWPANAPGDGPTTYKVWPNGITLNWGFDDISPVDSGWVNGTVFVDEDTQEWGVEMAIYVPQAENGAEIGFNVGGGQASQAALDEGGEATYGYYSWQAKSDGSAGGDVMNDASTFATLQLGSQTYGSGVVVDVPRVNWYAVDIDGMDDEDVWAEAPEFDLLQYANFYALVDEPDLQATGKTLYSHDTLYVFVRVLDNEIFTPEDAGDAWMSDQILIGVDGTHAGDDQIDDSYAGWPANAPGDGPTTYKVWPNGITLNWGFDDISPVDSGWVRGDVFVNEDTQEWGVEMAIYVPQIAEGEAIGFNIGGAQASQAALDEGGEATYGYFSWQAKSDGSSGGDVMNDASTFATLNMSATKVAIEEEVISEVPKEFLLRQNYPNPFNPTTTIEYAINHAGHVQLDIFNVLGQHVKALVDEQRAIGTYRVSWQAEGLSSGMYVYQLRVDGELVGSRKMVLLK